MVKNVKLKKLLKNTAFRVASGINKLIPKDDKIVLLYSANKGIQFSLIPLRKYLLDRGFYKNYHIYCGVESMEYAEKNDKMTYIPRLKSFLLFMRAGHVFYTTGQIPIKPAKNQCVIHMRHGNTNFKTMGKLTKIDNGDEFFFTHMAATASIYKPIMAKEFACSEDNIVVVGDPMIDELLDSPDDQYDFSEYEKMILWVPTFRQSDYLGYDDSINEGLVPLFDEQDYPALNEYLSRLNIKLIVKLHPAQDDNGKSQRHFKYLDVYTHEEFVAAGYSLYPLMKQSDVLIGDYSSASMQYLVLKKPQAFVIPDYDEYKKRRGFVFQNAKDYMAGHIIESKGQFYHFLTDIAESKDPYAEKRTQVLDMLYQYQDNHNCERIVNLSGMEL